MATAGAKQKAWDDVQSLKPIIEAARDEGDELRHLPDSIAEAFLERDVYRLLLPTDYGGAGIDPLEMFRLIVEVSRIDGSTGWNYCIGAGSGIISGKMRPEVVREIFATPECSGAASGPPQGRAVACDGGYRVTGRFAWASGIHHSNMVAGGCMVFDGDELRVSPNGGPTVLHALFPTKEVEILDTWKTGGMRGTGSTEFVVEDVFVPEDRTLNLFLGPPTHPDPVFRMPTSFFGFGLAAVPIGIALSSIDALKELALSKKLPPPRNSMAEQTSVQYAIGKGLAMVEATNLATQDAFSQLWAEVRDDGEANMETRSRLRRSMVHAVDTSIEVVSMCYRAAGGSALFESARFERALRDAYAVGGHVVFQRAMMEDVGRVELGLKPILPLF